MSVEMMTRAWQIEALSPPQKLVLLKLADVAGEDGAVLVPEGLRGAARQCGLARGTFRRALLELVAHGFVAERGRCLVLTTLVEASCAAG